jgi:hypothetical protein
MRLTKKTKCGYENECCEITECSDKLGQLEDIEEELGIDLITLFKALKFGVYYFTNAGQLTRDYVWLMDNYMGVRTNGKLSYSFMTMFEKQTLLFNDYGKTWALTKKELL